MQAGDSTDLPSPIGASPPQPEKEEKTPSSAEVPERRGLAVRAQRQKLPDERKSITHKFSVGGHEGYIIVGMYEDGRPGEVFIKMSKDGSTLSGVMDGLALTLSIGLQYGVPAKVVVDKLINMRFEPSGITENPEIRFASSILDYVGRWLGGKFISTAYLKVGTPSGATGLSAVAPSPPT
jgi:ribonucleoside-diphosphate reductase alpha chain